ncbi:MAG: site-2 protease family protein [Solirubrobacterales bacterium]|nr:site-2 protease family protein [Solirubrobacterales bacterium]
MAQNTGLGSKPRRRGAAGGILAALVAFGAKAKTILLAVTHFKFLLSIGSMVVSILAYGALWGIPFGVGFVALLLIHELGHVLEFRREGIKVSLPMFIPFMGAFVTGDLAGGDAAVEARIALAGPVVGSLAAFGCFLAWHAGAGPFWRALAYVGFFLNLLNLIPVLPLDGGRVMAAMSPLLWFAGYAVMIAVAVLIAPSPFFILIVVLGLFETWRRVKQLRSPAAAAYYKVHAVDRVLIGAAYVALVALLAMGLHAAYVQQALH